MWERAGEADDILIDIQPLVVTRCVDALGRDAATYHGHVVPPAGTTTTATTPATTVTALTTTTPTPSASAAS